MTASDNVDRLLGDIGLLQKYAQANTELQHCKRQLEAALAASSDYEAVKRERDELRQVEYNATQLAYYMVRLAMAHVGMGEDPSPSSSFSSSS